MTDIMKDLIARANEAEAEIDRLRELMMGQFAATVKKAFELQAENERLRAEIVRMRVMVKDLTHPR